MKKNTNKLTYVKSNDMIQVRGQVIRRDPLSETKRKIIAFEASMVQDNHTHETVFTIPIKEFAEICEIAPSSRNGDYYDNTFAEIYDLKTKAIAFVNERGNISIESYMDNIEVNRKEGTVSYTIPKALIPHFKMYSQFTKLDLLEYMPMRGQYALLLYELLMSWREAGSVYYTLEDLRRLLEVPEGAYPKNADFLRYVIYQPLEQVNERIKGRKIKYELKYGYRRKVEGVTFLIPKIKAELPPPKAEPRIEELEAMGQTSILDAIHEQAATASADLRAVLSPVLVDMIGIFCDEEEAKSLFEQYGEGYCAANIQYSRHHAKKDLAAYLRKALAGNWAKYIDQDKEKKEAAQKAAALEEKQLRKLQEETAVATEPLDPNSPFAQMAARLAAKKGV